MGTLARTGLFCAGFGVLGWLAILGSALLFPGGHPPLVAYVAVPVFVVLVPINLIGLGVSLRAWAARRSEAERNVGGLSTLLNLAFLTGAALAAIWTLVIL